MSPKTMYTSLVALFLYVAGALASATPYYFTYSTVTGYFLQDLNTTNATTFDYTATNFGLINQTYDDACDNPSLTQWQKFEIEIRRLNKAAPKGTFYKVLFMGRHGEGWHNAAESFYGTPAWNCYWSEINGNATASWVDAHLDAKGIAQARKAANFWAHEIVVQKIPVPDKYYTSPLARCLATANITFGALDLPENKPFVPLVKEYLREGISIHTCDHRSNKTWIHSTYPAWIIEPNFSEFDEEWNGVSAETSPAQASRSKAVLDEIMLDSGDATYISITSHSGELGSILSVLGHIPFSLNTGAVIPALVKVMVNKGTSTTTSAPYTVSSHCTIPPLSSISNGACVCPSSAAPVTTRLVTETPVVSQIASWSPTPISTQTMNKF